MGTEYNVHTKRVKELTSAATTLSRIMLLIRKYRR